MNEHSTLPRVGCGAAILRDGALLLVRRKRPPEAGHWGLPGGKVDPFEPVPAAAAREVREELGIVIEPSRLLCVIDISIAGRATIGSHPFTSSSASPVIRPC